MIYKRLLLLFWKVTLSVKLAACVLALIANRVNVTGGETIIGPSLVVSLTLVIVHVVVLVSGITVFNRVFFSVVFLILKLFLALSLRPSFIRLLIFLGGHLIIADIVTIVAFIFLFVAILHLVFLLRLIFKVELLLGFITGVILTLIFALIIIISSFIEFISAVVYLGHAFLIIVLGHLGILGSVLFVLRFISLGVGLHLLGRWHMHGVLMVAVLGLLNARWHRLSDFWNCCCDHLDRRDV